MKLLRRRRDRPAARHRGSGPITSAGPTAQVHQWARCHRSYPPPTVPVTSGQHIDWVHSKQCPSGGDR